MQLAKRKNSMNEFFKNYTRFIHKFYESIFMFTKHKYYVMNVRRAVMILHVHRLYYILIIVQSVDNNSTYLLILESSSLKIFVAWFTKNFDKNLNIS